MTKLFYDSVTHSIYIDEPGKSTKIELPKEVAKLDARYAVGSQAVQEIVKQLTNKGEI